MLVEAAVALRQGRIIRYVDESSGKNICWFTEVGAH